MTKPLKYKVGDKVLIKHKKNGNPFKTYMVLGEIIFAHRMRPKRYPNYQYIVKTKRFDSFEREIDIKPFNNV